MRKVFFVTALLLSLACSKRDATPVPVTPTAVEPSCPAGGAPRAQAKECGAVFQGCCFVDGAAACAAAGCADHCLQQESWPVQVACAPTDARPLDETAK